MNNIDKMPVKCQNCPYWELAVYPWYCRNCTEKMNPKNSEYIKRIDAKEALTALSADLDAETVQRCIEAMNNPKAADVEPVRHGYWVYKMQERNKCEFVTGFDHLGDWHTITVITHVKGPVPYCGLCGALAADSFLDYCPHCGAKMDGEPQEEDGDAE